MFKTLVSNICIPVTVNTIGGGAFEGCPVFQIIDIPHQAEVRYHVFNNCHLLSTTLEAHGGPDYMKGHFDELPIHQTCYKFNDTTAINAIINHFHSLQDNDPEVLVLFSTITGSKKSVILKEPPSLPDVNGSPVGLIAVISFTKLLNLPIPPCLEKSLEYKVA
jgi:hypothetical protein